MKLASHPTCLPAELAPVQVHRFQIPSLKPMPASLRGATSWWYHWFIDYWPLMAGGSGRVIGKDKRLAKRVLAQREAAAQALDKVKGRLVEWMGPSVEFVEDAPPSTEDLDD